MVKSYSESAFQRAWSDTEQFRASPYAFWGCEVLGAVTFGYIGLRLLPDQPSGEQSYLFPAVGVLGGLLLVFGLIFVVNLFCAPYRQRNEARKSVADLQVRLEPRLGLICEDGSPFVQQAQVSLKRGDDPFEAREVLFRVGVVNNGGQTINDVLVKMVSISPSPSHLPVPFTLHRMHDNPPEGHPHQSSFVLHPGQREYVDVVLKWDGVNEEPSDFVVIYHQIPKVNRYVPAARYVVTLVAYGNDTPPTDATDFVIDVNSLGELQFGRL